MIKTTALSNGIKIVTENISHAHSVSIGIWVKAGSRYEKQEEQGVSHFIEHMLFKGTDRHNAFDIAKVIDSVGGFINAFTGKEYTCLYVKVLKEHLVLAVDLLKDIFLNSLFAPEDIEKERSVIVQEINMIKDTPDEYVQELFNAAYFSGHPLGYPILGELETIQGLDKKNLLAFFTEEYLQPQHIIIAAAGNLEHEQLLHEIGDSFAGLELKPAAASSGSFVPQKAVHFNYRKLEQVHICIGTIGLSQLDPRRYALYVLNALFGGSMSSRLFQEIREKHGLAYSVYSFITSFLDTGLFGIYMGVRKEAARQALSLAHREIGKLKLEKIDAQELQSAKEQLKGNLLLSVESTDNRMSRLAKCEIYYDKYIPIEEVVSEIDAVTREDIQDVSNMIFSNDYLNYTFLGPLREKNIPAKILSIN
ncbi:MAG: pitrilysin family protein [Proteobacteria bacterium]|nr:pitrilysin family protein [Pseudomonadota bacterium]